MAKLLSDVDRIKYETYIRGKGDYLVQGRSYKKYPSQEEIANHLDMFNYTKLPEFRMHEVVVVQLNTVVVAIVAPTEEELAESRKRLGSLYDGE